jgi:hypothetical protein
MDFLEKIREIINKISHLSKKLDKITVFIITVAEEGKSLFLSYIRESYATLICSCEVDNLKNALSIIKEIDGKVDLIVVDSEKKNKNLLNLEEIVLKKVKNSRVLTYKDNDAWVFSVETLLSQIYKNIYKKKIAIFSVNNKSLKLAQRLSERGGDVWLYEENKNLEEICKSLNNLSCELYTIPVKWSEKKEEVVKDAEIVVGFSLKNSPIDKNVIKLMKESGLVIDAGIGNCTKDAIIYAEKRKISVYRLDIRAAYSGYVLTLIETQTLFEKIAGTKKIAGIRIVAGGYVGRYGDIVVDSISNPTTVYGIADGKGGLLTELNEEHLKKIKKVEEEIKPKILRESIPIIPEVFPE